MNNKEKQIIDKKRSTPIVFIIYNRVDYTQKVFDEIKKIKPKKLFVIADGPKNPSEEKLCSETRKIIDQVDWDCEVFKNYSEKNLGLKKRISSGLNWVFDNVEEAIILEDDCLPHTSFFRFASEMLEKYRENKNVMMVGGSNPLTDFEMKESYTFSKYYQIWGWATWKRAWKKYDIEMKNWKTKQGKEKIKEVYKQKYMRKHITKLFADVSSEKLDTWDVQWLYACLMNDGLSITPKVNLISNIGVLGVHQGGHNQNLPTYDIYKNDFIHPKTVLQNENYDNIFYEKNLKPQKINIIKKSKLKIISILVKYENIKKIYRFFLKIKLKLFSSELIKNINKTNYEKNCLLRYIIDPFKNKEENFNHQNYWQVKELTKILNKFSFNVDVIDHRYKKIKLSKKYDLVIDIHPILDSIYKNNLNKNSKKIFYATGSEPNFANNAEVKRINNLYKRKRIKLKTRRQTKKWNKKIYNNIDAIFLMGNKYNLQTYKNYFTGSKFLIKNTGYDFLKNNDFSQKSSKNFIFLSGGGQVHKGLDLLLEIFPKHPDLHLYICSPFKSEKDFCKLYNRELFKTPNIHPVGFISINSYEFMDLCKKCSFMIYPSCSEGQSGSVLSAMSAGIIPIVSKESGFNSEEVFILKNNSIDTIERKIIEFSKKDIGWIKTKSKKIINITEQNYSKKEFHYSFENALNNLF